MKVQQAAPAGELSFCPLAYAPPASSRTRSATHPYGAIALDPALILKAQGIAVDLCQRDLLLCADRQLLLNCCRQAGKSTVASALALNEVLFKPHVTVLIFSPGQRQSSEIFRKVLAGYNTIGRPFKAPQVRLRLPAVQPCNQAAIVHEVSKGRRIADLVVEVAGLELPPPVAVSPEQPHPLIAFPAGRRSSGRSSGRSVIIDFAGMARWAIDDGIAKAGGRI